MSADKIDHAEEARQFDYQAQMTHAGPDVAALLAARAQVHATLALVEQQKRIADRLDDFYSGAVLDVAVRS